MAKDSDYWTEARQRIFAISKIDSSCELVFGSKGHKYELLSPVPERQLVAFENKNDVPLPSEYRSFLRNFGAGGAGPDYGVYDFRTIESVSVKERFHLSESTAWPEADDDPMWDLPGLLPISTSGCAIDWSIEVNGPEPGTMWVDAGPGNQLMRCESFGTWYGSWLDRIEYGVHKYKLILSLIASHATMQQIVNECGRVPIRFEWDGVAYLKFDGIPGRFRVDGDEVLSFDVGPCWIL